MLKPARLVPFLMLLLLLSLSVIVSVSAQQTILWDETCPAGGKLYRETQPDGGVRMWCAVEGEPMPTPTVEPTVEPTDEPPSTPRPTGEPPMPTATVGLPTPTGEPPMPTATVGPPTMTPPPLPGDHDPTAWHPLTEEYAHHHGVNPAEYTGVFGSTLSDYLAQYGSISYPWQTPNENVIKHQGYIWLYSKAENGCEHYKQAGTGQNCVTDVLMQVHSVGTPMAVMTRNHSFVLFARVCDVDNMQQCGVMMTGGWHDYGVLHCPYKKEHCPLDSDPAGLPDFDSVLKHQPPYRTSHTDVRYSGVVQFWSSFRPNAIVADLYPHQPNNMAGIAWSTTDAWGYINPGDLDASPLVCEDGSCEFNHTRFQVFAVELYELPAGPFTGWTNRWGHVVDGCTTAGLDCVPFVVTSGMPGGNALLNRQVHHGNPDAAPILEFDNGMGWLRPPYMPMDMNMEHEDH